MFKSLKRFFNMEEVCIPAVRCEQLESSNQQNEPQPAYNIGQRCRVIGPTGEFSLAEVIQIRPSKKNLHMFDYYVHFDESNRRLDQWVSIDRFDTAYTAETKPSNGHTNAMSSVDRSDRKITRNQKRKYDEINHIQQSISEMDPFTAALEKEHEAVTKIKYIETIRFGKFEIDTWYFSYYPEEFGRAQKLLICEYCLRYMRLEKTFRYHLGECVYRKPPGKRIYKKGKLSVFEVDGAEHMIYCQCLCLLAKLFLDHKTLFFDTKPFLFYILTESDAHGAHIVGYFSKEKVSLDGHNLACLLTLPHHQRKGFGKFLIAFSYELSKREGLVGSPEKPLSDLGKLGYRSYWSWEILNVLKQNTGMLSIKEISRKTCIARDDIIDTLRSLNMLQYYKGRNIVCVNTTLIQDQLDIFQTRRPQIALDPDCLLWEAPKPTDE